VIWLLYLASIGALWLWMKNREQFQLKYIAAAHNLFICFWSIIMFAGICWEMYLKLKVNGVKGIYCDESHIAEDEKSKGGIYYWMYIYYISKFYELFDTVIIVLRKKPLIFLHVYHHCLVILMVWTWINQSFMYGSFGVAVNTFVHIFMYYFYYASVVGKRIWWKKYITTGQIIQFVSSFVLCIPYVIYTVAWNENSQFSPQCHGWSSLMFSSAGNLSFLLLFIRFYKTTYSSNPKKD